MLLLLSVTTYGQKVVKNVKGMATIANISPEEARVKAIDRAKEEALKLAGAEEWVQSFDFLEKREEHKKFDEFFHSLTSVQSMGSVVDWKVTSEDRKVDEFKNLTYEVTIDATVKLYHTRPDPEFHLAVNGINSVYKNLDKMNFEISPAKGGFLKIFLLDDARNVAVLYPNEHEPALELVSNKKYLFPQNSRFNYEVYTEKKDETNYLFLVYTKKDIPYKGGDSFSSFIEYVYTIEPAERFVSIERITIYK
ncbi:MAG TPA: DUF4384 domain-containing protein [Cyclobacteriaceae bacterium]|nr:DUF4384 domain-containing protein [Cyclobacteriaceae bacterium]